MSYFLLTIVLDFDVKAQNSTKSAKTNDILTVVLLAIIFSSFLPIFSTSSSAGMLKLIYVSACYIVLVVVLTGNGFN